MRLLHPEPISAEGFAAFGVLLDTPVEPGRAFFDDGLANARAAAWTSLSIARALPTAMPLDVTRMERHAFSSQSFIPLKPARWLTVVAPHAADGSPDGDAARVFLIGPGQAITYRMDVWHYPLTVLDEPGDFAILMWRDGGSGDEEMVPVARPFRVEMAKPERI
jgi:ureidoglycolate lyase